jgi:hypothetical protein
MLLSRKIVDDIPLGYIFGANIHEVLILDIFALNVFILHEGLKPVEIIIIIQSISCERIIAVPVE